MCRSSYCTQLKTGVFISLQIACKRATRELFVWNAVSLTSNNFCCLSCWAHDLRFPPAQRLFLICCFLYIYIISLVLWYLRYNLGCREIIKRRGCAHPPVIYVRSSTAIFSFAALFPNHVSFESFSCRGLCAFRMRYFDELYIYIPLYDAFLPVTCRCHMLLHMCM